MTLPTLSPEWANAIYDDVLSCLHPSLSDRIVCETFEGKTVGAFCKTRQVSLFARDSTEWVTLYEGVPMLGDTQIGEWRISGQLAEAIRANLLGLCD